VVDVSPVSARRDAPLASSRISRAHLERLAARVVSTDASGGVLSVEQPFTAQPLGEVPRSTLGDVDSAFARARTAQQA
jgi:acyl-CoA reductase-like NAD-dependent aldehyde dehydrogenase